MTRILILLLALTAGVTHASDDPAVSSGGAATMEQVRTRLIDEGYDVRKIEMEDGRYEAYAMKDGMRYEIYLDRDLKIIKTEMDD